MFITSFPNIYAAVLPEHIYEQSWDDLHPFFTKGELVSAKEDTVMFNLWNYKTDNTAVKRYDKDDRFIGYSRCIENCISLSGLVLDYDGKYNIETQTVENNPDPLKIIDDFEDYNFVIYTTYNHKMKIVNGEKIRKFRVVLPFENPIPAHDIFKRRENILARFPHIDIASLSGSQPFFLHSYNLENEKSKFAIDNKGAFFDLYSIAEDAPKQTAKVLKFKKQVSSQRKNKVFDALVKVSGLRHADALKLACIVKSAGGNEQDYLELCDTAFAADSSHHNKKHDEVVNEFHKAHDHISLIKINEFLKANGSDEIADDTKDYSGLKQIPLSLGKTINMN